MTVYNTSRQQAADYPLFFGERLSAQDYTSPKYPIFYKLYESQEEAHWRTREYDLSVDRANMAKTNKGIRHMFNSNFQFQIISDSVQGRGPFLLLPFISAPELELCTGSWGRFEQLHSAVYTEILLSLYPDPNEVLDPIYKTPERIIARNKHLIDAYDEFLSNPTKLNLFFCINAINILEALQFFNTFNCTFALNEEGRFIGVGKYLAQIARDENFHTAITQNILNAWYLGIDSDAEMTAIARDDANRYKVFSMWDAAVTAEKENIAYLHSEGGNLVYASQKQLMDYIEFNANRRMKNLGLPTPYDTVVDPLPWVRRKYLSSIGKQFALQETENNAYRVGTIVPSTAQELAQFTSMNPKFGV